MPVVEKVKTNLKDRRGSVKTRWGEIKAGVKTGLGEIRELKPIPGVLHIYKGIRNPLTEFIVDQSLITRRWIEGLAKRD